MKNMKKRKDWNHIRLERTDIKRSRPRGKSFFLLSIVALPYYLKRDHDGKFQNVRSNGISGIFGKISS